MTHAVDMIDSPYGRTCSIAGCGKRHDCHGLCSSHAKRLARYGDPLKSGPPPRSKCRDFIESVVLPYTGQECLRWPFGNNSKGYGVYHVDGRAIGVHVYVCERAHGPKPSPRHHAAHTCGKGHLLCCAPNHVRWASPKENAADKLVHGTVTIGVKNPSSKLTPKQVRQIRKLLGAIPQHKIAKQFDVCQMAISHIATGRSWGWLS